MTMLEAMIAAGERGCYVRITKEGRRQELFRLVVKTCGSPALGFNALINPAQACQDEPAPWYLAKQIDTLSRNLDEQASALEDVAN